MVGRLKWVWTWQHKTNIPWPLSTAFCRHTLAHLKLWPSGFQRKGLRCCKQKVCVTWNWFKFDTQQKKVRSLICWLYTKGHFSLWGCVSWGWECRLWSQTPWFTAQVGHLLAVWPWAGHTEAVLCASVCILWLPGYLDGSVPNGTCLFYQKHFDYKCLTYAKYVSTFCLHYQYSHLQADINHYDCCNKKIYWKTSGSSQNGKGQESQVWEKGRSKDAMEAGSKSYTQYWCAPQISSATGMHWTSNIFCCTICPQASESKNQRYLAEFLECSSCPPPCTVSKVDERCLWPPWFP